MKMLENYFHTLQIHICTTLTTDLKITFNREKSW